MAGVLVTLLDEQATTFTSDHLVDLVLNWVVPIAFIWRLVAFTGAYPDRVASQSNPRLARDGPGHA